MKSPRIVLIISLVLGLSCAKGWSQLAVKGRLILEEPFTIPAAYTKEYQSAQPGWRAKAWQQMWTHSGPGTITSKWTSGHMPVFALEGTLKDFVVELEFRYHKVDGQKALCRISALNPQTDPRAYAVSVWANADSSERPLGVVLERDVWKPGTITTVAREPSTFVSDTWYAVRLEVVGEQALFRCNGVTLFGQNEKFAMPKTVLAIGTGDCPHDVRGLRVYEATLDPTWKGSMPKKDLPTGK